MLVHIAHINAQTNVVGSLGGEVVVSPLGTASYSIPIEVSPGTNGVQPSLAVIYNSALGRGMLGTGWTLSGLSSITRIPCTPYYDNVTGSVNFDGNDRLALDGERLVKLGGGAYMTNGAVYGTETENFTRVTLNGSPNTDAQYFIVEDALGNVLEYGHTTDSKQKLAQGGVLSWLIDKVTDADGNSMEFAYQRDSTWETLPAEISYTKNSSANLISYSSVAFDYIADPNANKTYVGGNTLKTAKLLSSIRVTYDNNLVREYDFEYNFDRGSRLRTVTLKDGSGNELTTTIVDWNGDSAAASISTVGGLAGDWMVTGDFNGDNLTDLFLYSGDDEKTWRVRKGDGTGQFSPTSLTGTVSGYTSFFAIDLEGNGMDEVGYIVPNASNSSHYDLKAIRFQPSVTTVTLATNENSQFLLGDFKGSGGIQAARVGNPAQGYKTITIDSLGASLTVGKDDLVMVTDLNGNGKSDLLVVRNPWLDVYEYGEASHTLEKILDSHWFPENPARPCFGDINGDGNMDFIYYDYNNGDGRWRIKVSKGNDYMPPKTLPLNAAHGSYIVPLFPVLVSDLNGDGKDDLVQPVGYGSQPVSINVYYSRGYSDNGYLYDTHCFQNSNITNEYIGCFQFAEMNGDGKNELVHKNSVFAGSLVVASLPERREHDLVSSVTDGFGKSTTLEFSFYNSPCVSVLGADGRHFRHPLATRVAVPDGTGGSTVTEYTYCSAVFDYERRQTLGFLFSKLSQEGDCVKQVFMYNVDHHHLAPEQSLAYRVPANQGGPVGYVADTSGWHPGGGVLYHHETFNAPAFLDLAYGRYVPYNAVSSDINRLENKIVTTSVWLNAQGRVEKTASVHKKAKTENGALPWLERDSTVYAYTPVGLPNGATAMRPSNTHTWHRRNGYSQTPYTNTAVTYDANGRAATVTVSDSDGPVGVTSYTYNSLGLPVTETLTPSGLAARTETFSYDYKGRFLTGQTDALGHSATATYDHATGRKLTETDVNSLTTAYLYDALGRITRITRPDGTRHNVSYDWHNGPEFPDAIWTATDSESGTPLERTYHDILGRTVHTYVEGQGYHDVVYDSLGRVTMETAIPYDSPTAASGSKTWHRFTRDGYGRVVAETAPYTNLSYAYYDPSDVTQRDYFVTVTDSIRDVKSDKVFDVMGRLKYASDEGGEIGYTYAYQTIGGSTRDVTTVSIGGVSTVAVSDIRGNRLSVQDPDGGTVTSEYDALNQLRVRTDANGVSTGYSYDLAGRVTRVVYSKGNKEDIMTYTYDNAPGKGVGKPASVTHGGNLEREFEYDNLGRLANDIVVDGNTVYEQLYQYDSLGRLQYLSYPDGFLVRYTYNALGETREVVNAADNTLIYAIDTRDAFRNPVKCRFGNGTGTLYSYNAHGLLTGIRNGDVNFQTGGGATGVGMERPYEIGSQYRNLTYTYDARGFIVSRTDSTANQTETYSYDALDRLVSHTVNGIQTVSVAYGDNGNITQKTGVGVYGYSIARPHAVTQVSGVPSHTTPLPPQCDVTYNLMNRLESLSGGGYSVGLDHYASGVRRHTSVSYLNSLVKEKTRLSNLFETEETPTANRRIDFVYAEGRVVAARVYENGTGSLYYVLTDHLGSWERVLDGNRNTAQQTHFDPWGNRMDFNAWGTPQTQTSFLFDRGFTGHEHYDFLRVINANARLYDPVIGRFFSPDPFVQAPDFSQNYNRYSYCMNNPVMYSDPDGELFATVLGFVSDVFYNLFNQSDQDGGWDWSRTRNGWEIDMGLFETDPNKSGWGRFWEFLSRFTWQFPQTYVGNRFASFSNAFGQVDEVEYYGGTTVSIGNNYGVGGAVTIGNYINGSGSLSANPDNYLFQHEYGHYLQSQAVGPFYLGRYGIPSLLNCMGEKKHEYHPVEQDADIRAFKYFNKHISGFDWNFDYHQIVGYNKNLPITDKNNQAALKNGRLRPAWYEYILMLDPLTDGIINWLILENYRDYYEHHTINDIKKRRIQYENR